MDKLKLVTLVATIAVSQTAVRITASRDTIAAAAEPVAQASAQDLAPEACALFTLEEVGMTLGRSFPRARPGKAPGATTCAFVGGTEGTINVLVSPSSSKKEFDDLRQLVIEQGEQVEAVTGVGDDAYYWDTRIYLRVGKRCLVIWNSDPSQPAAKVRADVLALAELGAAKLR